MTLDGLSCNFPDLHLLPQHHLQTTYVIITSEKSALPWEPPYTGVPRPSGPEIPKKSQKGLSEPPGPECQNSVKKASKDPKRVKKVSKAVFGDFFDTFLTLWAGQPGKTFLRLFGDFGPRGPPNSCIRRFPSQSQREFAVKIHWEIKGRFRKGWFWRTYPRSGFRSGGTSAETTLLETTLLSTPKRVIWEIKGRFPKGWFWRTYPRSGFRSGGTSAKTTLLETTLL